ncbi:MAG: hypothetical protein SFW62_02050 [Alphaproteobacteria bacterium]|nr:hypothetical protein [Alphaproteobacteria bacterium]
MSQETVTVTVHVTAEEYEALMAHFKEAVTQAIVTHNIPLVRSTIKLHPGLLDEAYGDPESRSNFAHMVAMHGCHELVPLIQEQRPELLQGRNRHNNTPFSLAVAGHDEETALAFCAVDDGCAARGNIFNSNVLHIAAQHGTDKLIQVIAQKYPNMLDEPNDLGRTPLEAARFWNRSSAVATLESLLPEAEVERGEPRLRLVGGQKFAR